MPVLAILAFAAGLLLGCFCRPLAIVALATAFVGILVVFGTRFGIAPVPGVLLAVVLINFGYLAGALMTRRWTRSEGSGPVDDL